MGTSLSGGGRHRRGYGIAAAGVAAAVGAALLASPAGASPALPQPTVNPAMETPSLDELTRRVVGAMAGDDIAGQTNKSSLSKNANPDSAIDAKIIGGSTTSITSAPWMAQLHYYDDRGTSGTGDDIGFFCSGAVVAPTKILTAAHCAKGYDWHNNGAIVTGTAQLPSADGDLHGGTVSGVWRQWNDPRYNANTIDNDIALLTLPAPVRATPIRMTTAGDTASYAAGTNAKVYGWGRTSSTSQAISETLKTATLPIQSDATCTDAWGSDFVKGHMVCAGEPASGSDEGTTSACNGDSGGPLVVNNRIVGVVSWGVVDCVAEGAYSVFTKVTDYVGVTYPRVDDTDINGDHRADLWLRHKSTGVGYSRNSRSSSFGANESWGDWSGVDLVLQTDLDRDGYQDLVYRRGDNGNVYWSHYVISTGDWSTKLLVRNWKSVNQIITPGDVTGDYVPDLLMVDSAGVLWTYPGKGNGSFSARLKTGSSGWNAFNFLGGHGDFTGDGRTDLIARYRSNGDVYLYKGTGKAGAGSFGGRVKLTTWKNTTFNDLVTVGDVSGDGKADLLARTPGGTMYQYRGTGKNTAPFFSTRVSVGTGFQHYDIFG
ncbi:trypsin-like serine protease [Streptomyces sp. CHD11]|uniref:trypsin-like serine protease n=1 Tax=Streptomyces sp. CHD11 TaxID=2741325 RepID=UPI001BFC8F78|nr:trypsin-like serine protease [Streptomyces sp. CHD11]MBT3153358.1 trypsin-like serine protease [Streptomyces sp. CHD11]